ncbi:PREDICTED: uncharacterized protein LOC104610547 isoform X1 [Nelumbo nucifera]|uniref:Uncharacterized protein LOC104610547 isoform X1 n=2 Tax=Nelumbo nucifera TaxID=4432 RepID=A0A1U8BFE5_NELNU|nr:PREDICTED: uncharacterized protein LOC104610547 isoform X1 [Nelumbo nucifera]
MSKLGLNLSYSAVRGMEEENTALLELNSKAFHIFSDFMTRITQLEELVSLGSKLLCGLQESLELLRRPPVNKKSEVVDAIIKANETMRLKAYLEAGCITANDGVQSIRKLHECKRGLHDHLNKDQAKSLLNELESLIGNIVDVVQAANEIVPDFGKHSRDELVHQATSFEKGELESHDIHKPEVSDYAATMGIVYSMVKQDYTMQEKIISSLSLNSSSGELESYTLMWSLRPFINEDIMHQAWRFIPQL